MAIHNLSDDSEIFQTLIELSHCDVADIDEYLSSVPLDEHFPSKLVTLIHILKLGESSYGEYDEHSIHSIHDALDRNSNFQIIGTGGFCICISNKKSDICYKINLMSLSYDVGIEYASVIHNSKFNPLVPTVYDVYIFNDTYCAVMEKLKSVSGSFMEWYNENLLSDAIKYYNADELIIQTSKYSNSNLKECREFLVIIKSIIDKCNRLKIEIDIDVMSFNLMMRDKQLVFIDPLFPVTGYH